MQINPWVIINLGLIIFTLPLSVYALLRYFRENRRQQFLAFGVLTFSIVLWEINSIFVEVTTTTDVKLFWNNFGNAVTVPLLLYSFIWFAVVYSRSDLIGQKQVGVLAVFHISIVSVLVTLQPTFLYEITGLVTYGPITFSTLTFGEWIALERTLQLPFKLLQIYIYVVVFVGGGILFRHLYRNRGEISIQQTILIAIGVFSPIIANSLIFIGVVPPMVNTTDLAFGITGIVFGVVIFRYRMFSLVPMGREQLVDTMDDPIIMLDGDSRVVDSNEAARRIVGVDANWRSMAAVEFLSPFPQLRERIDGKDMDLNSLEFTINGKSLYFDVSTSSIEADRGEIGKLVVMRDVTARKRRENELEKQKENLETLNKMVRHDIRNDLQLVIAYAETLSGHVDTDGESYLNKLQTAAYKAVDVTETAREVTEVLLKSGQGLKGVDLHLLLEEEIKDVKEQFEDAKLSVSGPIDDVCVQADELLGSVFRNILTNGVIHNDSESPEIRVSVENTGDEVQIRFADNGPGIPEEKRDVLFQEGEKGLDSEGTGLGLYIVKTLVNRYGGDVWVEENSPRGSIFVVELRIVD